VRRRILDDVTPFLSRWSGALALAVLAAGSSGCAGPQIELQSWRAEQLAAAAVPAHDPAALAAELQRVAELREGRELAQARQLALALASEHPDDPGALTAASCAESDAVFLFAEDDKRSRNHAAASALDYALSAQQRGADAASDRAQLAWALGTSTHLQPMFSRAGHARRTLEAAEAALALDPDESLALATLALVNLRLETLPWIADVMAWGAPDSSLEAAEDFARRAVASVPSREHRQILAKVLIARDKLPEARAELDAALAASAVHPRDTVLEPAVRRLRKSLE
jgi:tetratricopeptide (TPR) repeat protein